MNSRILQSTLRARSSTRAARTNWRTLVVEVGSSRVRTFLPSGLTAHPRCRGYRLRSLFGSHADPCEIGCPARRAFLTAVLATGLGVSVLRPARGDEEKPGSIER